VIAPVHEPTPHLPAPSSWEEISLAAVLAGDQEDGKPTILTRSDGVGLIYSGRLHMIAGEPESGKGWLACHATAEQLAAGHHTAYFDHEDVPATVVGRLRDLGVSAADILERFHYVRPEEPLPDRAYIDRLLDFEPTLVVVDGLTEALALEGLELKDNSDIARYIARVARPLKHAGAAVALIDHVTKDRETRGRFAIGAQHKLAAVDVSYRLDVLEPFGREREGLVKVTVTKDRAGYVRGHAEGDRIALLRLSSRDGEVSVTLDPPDGQGDGGSFRPTHLMERVSRALEGAPDGLGLNAIRSSVKGNNDAKTLALELLTGEGYVRRERVDGRSVKHLSERAYREADETAPNRAQPRPGRGSADRAHRAPALEGAGCGRGSGGSTVEDQTAPTPQVGAEEGDVGECR